MKGFVKVARSLTRTLRKDTDLQDLEVYKPDQVEAFNGFKEALVTTIIVTLPTVGRPLDIGTDASMYQIGCSLLQEKEDISYRPVVYLSSKLKEAERNYSSKER